MSDNGQPVGKIDAEADDVGHRGRAGVFHDGFGPGVFLFVENDPASRLRRLSASGNNARAGP